MSWMDRDTAVLIRYNHKHEWARLSYVLKDPENKRILSEYMNKVTELSDTAECRKTQRKLGHRT